MPRRLTGSRASILLAFGAVSALGVAACGGSRGLAKGDDLGVAGGGSGTGGAAAGAGGAEAGTGGAAAGAGGASPACSSATLFAGHQGSALSCTLATPAVPSNERPVDHQADIAALGLGTLDQLIGRFLRGETPVYRGTASAQDNEYAEAEIRPSPEATLSANGTALAALNGLDLSLYSACEKEVVDVTQDPAAPGQSEVTSIRDPGTGFSVIGTCTGCIPDLSSVPARLTWTNADAESTVPPTPNDVAHHTFSSANLGRVSPCDLTWNELATVNGIDLDRFQRVGDYMVLRTTAQRIVKQPSGKLCDGEIANYSIEMYVNLANLADYGTRNFSEDAPSPACGV